MYYLNQSREYILLFKIYTFLLYYNLYRHHKTLNTDITLIQLLY